MLTNQMALMALYTAKGSFIATTFTITTLSKGLERALWASLALVVAGFTTTTLSLLLWCRPLSTDVYGCPFSQMRIMCLTSIRLYAECLPTMELGYLMLQAVIDGISTVTGEFKFMRSKLRSSPYAMELIFYSQVIALSLIVLRSSSREPLCWSELAFATFTALLGASTILLSAIQIPISAGPSVKNYSSTGTQPLLSIVSAAIALSSVCLPVLWGSWNPSEPGSEGHRVYDGNFHRHMDGRRDSFLEGLAAVRLNDLQSEAVERTGSSTRTSWSWSKAGMRAKEVVPSASSESLGLYA